MARRGALPVCGPSDEELWTAYTKVRASVARFSNGDGEDVAQEAVARAVRHRVRGDIEPWLRTVSRRIAIDTARRRREHASGAAADIEQIRPLPTSSAEDVAIANEGVGLIRKAIRRLPSRYREALVTYAEEEDSSAVAAKLGVSANAACTLLCRARARLRQELDRVGYAACTVVLKVQRWQELAATATAAVCFVAMAASPQLPQQDSQENAVPTTAVAAPASEVLGVRRQAGPAASRSRPERPRAQSGRTLSDADRIVEAVAACSPQGGRLRRTYVELVRSKVTAPATSKSSSTRVPVSLPTRCRR